MLLTIHIFIHLHEITLGVGISYGMAWCITGVSPILVQVHRGLNLSDSSFGWVQIGECGVGRHRRLVGGHITPLLRG